MTGDPAVFEKHSKGRVIEPMESILRTTFTEILPTDIQYALTVPIYNIDKRPFAILCAYSTIERTTPFVCSLLIPKFFVIYSIVVSSRDTSSLTYGL